MAPEHSLPDDLHRLFPASLSAGRSLPVSLPPGRLITPGQDRSRPAFPRLAVALRARGRRARPAYWLSADCPPLGLWARLRAAHSRSGLWPLLLSGLRREPERPWVTGEVSPARSSSPAAHDPAAVLAAWWSACHPELPEQTAPYGGSWPGLAAAGVPQLPAEQAADELADLLGSGQVRLGLVAADRGADALAVAGWTGPANHTIDTAQISAVLRGWEERFGARIVGVGFDTLHVSVAAPPTGVSHALQVAAEHLAFCPDTVRQGTGTVVGYAEEIRAARSWSFWWD